jgi:hypothetical protein
VGRGRSQQKRAGERDWEKQRESGGESRGGGEGRGGSGIAGVGSALYVGLLKQCTSSCYVNVGEVSWVVFPGLWTHKPIIHHLVEERF